MHRLRHQAHAPGNANAPDRLEARFAAGSKSFVQGFASDAGIFGGSGVATLPLSGDAGDGAVQIGAAVENGV